MTVNNIANDQMALSMARIASGQRVNSAADDAAGLAIVQGMEGQIRGLDQGIDNTRDMQNLLNTADGALENIGDGLNRIRELSIQASNGTLTQADRDRIQSEISEMVDHIEASTRNTQFNTMPLLDGSYQNQNTQIGPNFGGGQMVNIGDMSEVAQAITSFNVTEELSFDALANLDQVMADVNGERANLGAMNNRLDSAVENNATASENLILAQSQIQDADIAEEMAELQQANVLNQMEILMQQQEQQLEEQQTVAPLMAAGA
ncbi:MAG: flagellin [Defluviitaleaceae bacterium]|nr:flagellin [Defluviitaleaceae bacterium]MCL2273905.1 flagellin [Defluviitaleaceae bacterium]